MLSGRFEPENHTHKKKEEGNKEGRGKERKKNKQEIKSYETKGA